MRLQSIIIYRAKSYRSQFHVISFPTFFLSHIKCHTLLIKLSQVQRIKDKKFSIEDIVYWITRETFSWGKVHPVLFLRLALRLANCCFIGTARMIYRRDIFAVHVPVMRTTTDACVRNADRIAMF